MLVRPSSFGSTLHHVSLRRVVEKVPALAWGVRLPQGMKTSKVLTSVLLYVALTWTSTQMGRHFFPKLRKSLPTVEQLAVVALAAAAEAKDGHEGAKSAALPPAPGVATSESGFLPPIGEGPADGVEGAAPAPIAEAVIEFECTDALAGTQQGFVETLLTGNGRERMNARFRNNSPTPLRVRIPAGQVLESGRNRVVVTRAAEVELMPAKSVDMTLSTAAIHSSNVIAEAPYRLSYQGVERLDAFLTWAAEHGDISVPAMQTAVLALTENLPLNALAKFAPANGAAGTSCADAFRAETGDILAALAALRDSGVKMENIAMTVDRQLRIEAMIEPLSREAAKRFYGITELREWDFWKHELLEGSPTTRHYALFGIARFYPDIALEMLPKWARETQTHPVYRNAAVQALADTQRAEALPLLRQIAEEVGPQTELGKTATQAAAYLDRRLTEMASRSQVVAFRAKNGVTGF